MIKEIKKEIENRTLQKVQFKNIIIMKKFVNFTRMGQPKYNLQMLAKCNGSKTFSNFTYMLKYALNVKTDKQSDIIIKDEKMVSLLIEEALRAGCSVVGF